MTEFTTQDLTPFSHFPRCRREKGPHSTHAYLPSSFWRVRSAFSAADFLFHFAMYFMRLSSMLGACFDAHTRDFSVFSISLVFLFHLRNSLLSSSSFLIGTSENRAFPCPHFDLNKAVIGLTCFKVCHHETRIFSYDHKQMLAGAYTVGKFLLR